MSLTQNKNVLIVMVMVTKAVEIAVVTVKKIVMIVGEMEKTPKVILVIDVMVTVHYNVHIVTGMERFGETVWPGFSGLVLVEAIKRLYVTPDNGHAEKVARPKFSGSPVMNKTTNPSRKISDHV